MSPFFRLPHLLLFLLAAAWAGCAKKAEPLDAAQTFFQQVAAGRAAEAYQSASFSFQAQQSEKTFEARVREIGLTDYTGAEWEAPEIDGRTAKFSVNIATQEGAKLPFNVVLIYENDAWRLYSLKPPASAETGLVQNSFSLLGKTAGFTDSSLLPMPDDKELRRLTRDVLVRFNAAIAARSFDEFYTYVSRKWQERLTQGQLARAFQPFIDHDIKLDSVATMEPVFDRPAAIDTDGLLVVTGYYPTQPYRTVFSLQFTYELPKWKVFGIEVNLFTYK